VLSTVVAAIPAPPSNGLSIGPLNLRMYGLMIGLGVMAAIWLTGKRFEETGIGTKDQAASIGIWGAAGGVIGARVYHVVTDWQLFEDDLGRIPQIWKGGLGIWGGIALGIVVGLWRAKKFGMPLGRALDCAVPSLPLAQAIGRLGNWWNQELFGGPSDLPWALKVDPEFRPARYIDSATFQPTFLYEALWNLLLCVVLLWVGRRNWLRTGRLVALYVCGYTLVRFFLEGIRTDPANEIAGLRINEWMSIIGFVLGGLVLLNELRHRGEPRAVDDGGVADGTTALLVAAAGLAALQPSDESDSAEDGVVAGESAHESLGDAGTDDASFEDVSAVDVPGGDGPGGDGGASYGDL
jgi:prolipoprotein diacylglyceryl transferase